jgi:hypothetical protein
MLKMGQLALIAMENLGESGRGSTWGAIDYSGITASRDISLKGTGSEWSDEGHSSSSTSQTDIPTGRNSRIINGSPCRTPPAFPADAPWQLTASWPIFQQLLKEKSN